MADIKLKAVECLVNMFNTEAEMDSCNIVINDITFVDAKCLEVSNDYVLIRSCVKGGAPVTGIFSIDDINTIHYMDDCFNIISLANIEF